MLLLPLNSVHSYAFVQMTTLTTPWPEHSKTHVQEGNLFLPEQKGDPFLQRYLSYLCWAT
jgi:hypothetical protein